jgi:hypothetical protein
MERGATLPDPSVTAVRATGDAALQSFAALVMSDAALAARLAAIEDADTFVAQAIQSATAHDIALPEASLLIAARPDPLRLALWSPPLLGGSVLPPRDWLPIAVAAEAGSIAVDWARFGPEPLRGSFYEMDIRRALWLPFNRAFRYRTGLADLIARAETLDSRTPDGFIFHMSRCGSTLVAQMLAALSDSIVIAEAPPIDAIVQFGRNLPEDDAIGPLRAMVAALGRQRSGRERRYIVKLDCWHTLALPLFRRAFPRVPWLFLYRDPAEVLVSQMRQRGMQMVPQFLPPGFYGIDAADVGALDEDYCARVLAAVCQATLDHRRLGGGLFLNYRDLPGAVGTTILPHFGLSCSDDELATMQHRAVANAKSPGVTFTPDAESKRQAATNAIRSAADRHLGEIYACLEALSAKLS